MCAHLPHRAVDIQETAQRLINLEPAYRLNTDSDATYALKSYVKLYNARSASGLTKPTVHQQLEYVVCLCQQIQSHVYTEQVLTAFRQYMEQSAINRRVVRDDDTLSLPTTLSPQQHSSVDSPLMPLHEDITCGDTTAVCASDVQHHIDTIYDLYMSLLHTLLHLSVHDYTFVQHSVSPWLSPILSSEQQYLQINYDVSVYQAMSAVQQWYQQASDNVSATISRTTISLVEPVNDISTSSRISRVLFMSVVNGFNSEYIASVLLKSRHRQHDVYAQQHLHYIHAVLATQSNTRTATLSRKPTQAPQPLFIHPPSSNTNCQCPVCYCFARYTDTGQMQQPNYAYHAGQQASQSPANMAAAQQLAQQQSSDTKSPFAGMSVEQIYQALFANRQMAGEQQPTFAQQVHPTQAQQTTPLPYNLPNLTTVPTMATHTQPHAQAYFDIAHTVPIPAKSIQHSYAEAYAEDHDSDAMSNNSAKRPAKTKKAKTNSDDSKQDGSGSGSVSRKRGKTLPDDAVEYMQQWLFANYQHPYPSEAQKQQIGQHCGLTAKQVNYWFINARARKVRKNQLNTEYTQWQSTNPNAAVPTPATQVALPVAQMAELTGIKPERTPTIAAEVPPQPSRYANP